MLMKTVKPTIVVLQIVVYLCDLITYHRFVSSYLLEDTNKKIHKCLSCSSY